MQNITLEDLKLMARLNKLETQKISLEERINKARKKYFYYKNPQYFNIWNKEKIKLREVNSYINNLSR
jgi:hypothetical protein